MKPLTSLEVALKGKSLLIFDFDGTVADTSPLHEAAFSEVLAPFGLDVDYSSIAGLKTLDAIRKCFQSVGRVLDDSLADSLAISKQQSVRQMFGHKLQPMPGVEAFLLWARSRYRLAMVTSGSRGTVNLALEQLGYSDWFDPLICADDVKLTKPNPEGFLAVTQITNVPLHEALIFEDSFAGVTAAKNAGIDCFEVMSTDTFLSQGAFFL
jgi:HAD superfamily hydrolase (TIGR01509 family)